MSAGETRAPIPYPDNLVYARFVAQANVERNRHYSTDSQIANPHLLSNLRSLRFCRKCWEPYGSIQLPSGQTVQQECSCHRQSNVDLWVEHDLNREYEICCCCGLEIIPSGFGWSSLYCADCWRMVTAFNRAIGFCFVPLTRDPAANTVPLDGDSFTNEAWSAKFFALAKGLSETIAVIEKHRRQTLEMRMYLNYVRKGGQVTDLLLNTLKESHQEHKRLGFATMLSRLTRWSFDDTERACAEVVGETQPLTARSDGARAESSDNRAIAPSYITPSEPNKRTLTMRWTVRRSVVKAVAAVIIVASVVGLILTPVSSYGFPRGESHLVDVDEGRPIYEREPSPAFNPAWVRFFQNNSGILVIGGILAIILAAGAWSANSRDKDEGQ